MHKSMSLKYENFGTAPKFLRSGCSYIEEKDEFVPMTGSGAVSTISPSERRGTNSRRVKDFNLKAKTRIWS